MSFECVDGVDENADIMGEDGRIGICIGGVDGGSVGIIIGDEEFIVDDGDVVLDFVPMSALFSILDSLTLNLSLTESSVVLFKSVV